MSDSCPSCGKAGISGWAWLYAYWPFSATCSFCHAKVRRGRHSLWLDVSCQIIASLLITLGVVGAIVPGGYLWLFLLMLSAGIFLAFLPYLLGKFVVASRPGHAAS
jgi:hypothetical protein